MNPNDIPASSWQIVVASKDETIAELRKQIETLKAGSGKMILTKEQRTALCEAILLAEQLNGVVCKDDSIISIDPHLPATLRSLLSDPPSWKVTEERRVAIKDAITELKEAEELVYETDINVLWNMIEEARL